MIFVILSIFQWMYDQGRSLQLSSGN